MGARANRVGRGHERSETPIGGLGPVQPMDSVVAPGCQPRTSPDGSVYAGKHRSQTRPAHTGGNRGPTANVAVAMPTSNQDRVLSRLPTESGDQTVLPCTTWPTAVRARTPAKTDHTPAVLPPIRRRAPSRSPRSELIARNSQHGRSPGCPPRPETWTRHKPAPPRAQPAKTPRFAPAVLLAWRLRARLARSHPHPRILS